MADRSSVLEITGSDAMRDLGRQIGRQLLAGETLLLHGDLGAGKTTLAQGVAAGLRIDSGVQSPTFTLISEYPAVLGDGTLGTLYHLDLYRLNDPEELGEIGWDEAMAPERGVTLVEWPERAGEWLPERFVLVTIAHRDADSREVTISSTPPDRAAELIASLEIG